ncbi:EF-hand calcium-binding domain-containing protein [Acrasis kona]|uniref:EF-hand calcium-binding domain-containing protein n=1 Tax=Acrasis kona TaxID=1008807 RepID=A0AAW2ZHG9_9EUKA
MSLVLDFEKIISILASVEKDTINQIKPSLKLKSTNINQYKSSLVSLYQIISQDVAFRDFFRYIQDCIVQTVVMLSPRGMTSEDDRMSNSTPRVSGISFPINRKHTHQINLSEFTFCTIMQELTIDCSEHVILDLFDTLDVAGRGTVNVESAYMLILIHIAREAGITTRFLYQFGSYAYDLFMLKPRPNVAHEDSTLIFTQDDNFRKLGQICLIDEYDMTKILRDFISSNSKRTNCLMSREEFIPLYFVLFKNWDQKSKKNNL